jgi:hypothetical protein
MSRTSASQRQRTQDNPLNLGTFSQLAVRKLNGTLGPVNQLVGRSDTSQTSNGGYGGGTYNHWFRIGMESPAWIIVAKGGPRPKYIQTSVYNLNLNPIQGRMIFQKDSITTTSNGTTYYPYNNHVMGAPSDLYNEFDARRLDEGNSLYFPLEAGSYLLCVSTTRNEPLEYNVAFVVEFPTGEFELLLEDYTYLLLEDTATSYFEADVTENYRSQDFHSHSLTEWTDAWKREHQEYDVFPAELVPLATQP